MNATVRDLVVLAAAAVAAGVVLGAGWLVELLYVATWGRP